MFFLREVISLTKKVRNEQPVDFCPKACITISTSSAVLPLLLLASVLRHLQEAPSRKGGKDPERYGMIFTFTLNIKNNVYLLQTNSSQL